MGGGERMTEKRAELLLAAVISARATSFVFNKLVLGSLGTFDLLACRFLMAFVLLAVLFWKKLRHISGKALLHGAVLGTLLFLTLTAELTALKTTDSSMVSLLENTAIILVPLLEAVLLRRLPTLVSLAIVCTGFGFTLQPVAQSHTSAERAGLFCALSPACATLFGAVLLHEKITLLGAAGILLILSSLLLPHLMKGKRSHEVQGDPV